MNPDQYTERAVWLCCAVASIAGLLSGYIIGSARGRYAVRNERRKFWLGR